MGKKKDKRIKGYFLRPLKNMVINISDVYTNHTFIFLPFYLENENLSFYLF